MKSKSLKGVFAVTAGVAIAASMQASVALADDLSSPISGCVTADILNVRTRPNTSSSVIGTLTYNTNITVLEIDNGWYRINYNGNEGWVYGDYVSLSSNSDSSSTSSYSSQGTVTADVLNFRSGPGTGYTVIDELYYGQAVNILSRENGWCYITCNGRSGYVSADYIEMSSSSSSSSSSTTQGTVDADALNLRSGAGTGYSVIGTLYYGSTVKILGTSGNWYRVDFNGTKGYVSADYIVLAGSSNSSSDSDSSSSESPSQNYLFEGTVDADALNFREDASMDSHVIATLYYGQSVDVISEYGNWYKVNYNGTIGFVWRDYIVNESGSSATPEPSVPSTPSYDNVTGKVAIVTADALNVRSGAGTEHSILGVVRYGSKLPIISYYSGWYKVQFGSSEGYVSADYVTVTNENDTMSAIVKQTPLVDCAYTGRQIADKAKEYLGVPYVWGGFTPLGFDCSGLVQYVYRQCGVNIERTTYYQVHQGQIVDKNNLQPGDLIFFTTNDADPNDVSHVGMYVGDGLFIHAPKPGDIVKISDLNAPYYTSAYYVAKRIIK